MPNSLKKMVLLPRPRRIIPKVGGLVLPAQGRIVCNSDAAQLLPLALQVQGDLARLQQVHWDLGAGSGGSRGWCAASGSGWTWEPRCSP